MGINFFFDDRDLKEIIICSNMHKLRTTCVTNIVKAACLFKINIACLKNIAGVSSSPLLPILCHISSDDTVTHNMASRLRETTREQIELLLWSERTETNDRNATVKYR